MSRRLSWVALLATVLLLLGTTPAVAVGPFGPAEVAVPSCSFGMGDAAIAVDGTTRGLGNCTNEGSAEIWFFRAQPGVAPFRQLTPYRGVVLAVAWDGAGSTYVLFQQDSQLKIGKRVDSSGIYASPATLAVVPLGFGYTVDLVASGGRWWAVWTQPMGVDRDQSVLFQKHTLLGVQGPTQITSGGVDFSPTLAYANGRMTLLWAQVVPGTSSPVQTDLRIASSTGGAWSSRPFATLGLDNDSPDVTVYGGVTWVAWARDGTIALANNSGGTFHSRAFATAGSHPTVAVSGSHVFVAWHAALADRVYLAQLADGSWSASQAAGAPSFPLRVLAQATKARIIFRAPGAIYIRTQT
jgi:hypothetical protein